MTHHGAEHVVGEISVEPVVEGAGHGELVSKAIEALDGPELTVKPGALSTTIEGGLDDVLHAVARAHRAVTGSSERVITTVRIEGKSTGIDLADRESTSIR